MQRANAVLAKETATVELTHSQQPINIMERVGGKRRRGEGENKDRERREEGIIFI